MWATEISVPCYCVLDNNPVCAYISYKKAKEVKEDGMVHKDPTNAGEESM